MTNAISQINHGIIVSCQSEGDDPFNRPEYIALFARAAEMGGACGIRAREAGNIRAVRAAVSLPVIGITKGGFPDGSVLITPDFDDVQAVIDAGAAIVAVDATQRIRPNGLSGKEFVAEIKKRWDVPLMADISTLEEGLAAEEAGADVIGTTLAGYTPYTKKSSEDEPDWELLGALCSRAKAPVVAEGRIWTPDQAREAFELGAYAVVVGTAITRPRVVTRRFVEAVGD
ncbi:MAG: N-acetylmannosamine-6-phosphate 2-epimerase [Armatimonadota bacterium]|nr:N-acetylmannosamine-6-phosphate 2-epimerase [Armatimonadota bacterium]